MGAIERETKQIKADIIKNDLTKWFSGMFPKPLQSLKEVYSCTKSKCKAVPLQAWRGPGCSRKLSFPDFVTTAQDVGKVVSLTHRPPLPQEILLVLISVRG